MPPSIGQTEHTKISVTEYVGLGRRPRRRYNVVNVCCCWDASSIWAAALGLEVGSTCRVEMVEARHALEQGRNVEHVLASVGSMTDSKNIPPPVERKVAVDDRQQPKSGIQAEMMAFMNQPTSVHRERRPKPKASTKKLP